MAMLTRSAAMSSSAKPLVAARQTVRVQASAAARHRSLVRLSAPAPRDSVRFFRLLSQSVEHNAAVARFESLGGRAAMVGLTVALVSEIVLDNAIMSQVSAGFVESAAVVTVVASAAVASIVRRPEGAALLEAVLTSLTSGGRSANSVTGQNVDKAVDSVFDQIFTPDLTHILETLTDRDLS